MIFDQYLAGKNKDEIAAMVTSLGVPTRDGKDYWQNSAISYILRNERYLDRVNWQVDCVLTHCAPTSILKKLDERYAPDRLTDFLETVKRRCRFDYWFLGHYHRNCVVDDRFIVQWEQIIQII